MREPCRRFTGRVEFLACKPEVVAQLKAGRSVRMIYDELKSQGKITIHYGTFWRYAVCIPGIFHEPLRPAGKRARKAGGAPDIAAGIETGPALPALRQVSGVNGSGGQGGIAPAAMLPALQGDDFTPKAFSVGNEAT